MTTHRFNISVANISYYNQSVLYNICIKLQCYPYTRTQPFIISMWLVQIRLHVYCQHGWVSLRFNYSNLWTKPWVFVIHPIFHNPCRNHRKVVTFFQHCSTNNANAYKCIFRLLNLGHILWNGNTQFLYFIIHFHSVFEK